MKFYAIFVSLIFFFISSSLNASTNRFNLINNYPSQNPTNYFFIKTTDQLGKGNLLLGNMVTYGYQPLRITRGGVHVRDGMEHLFVDHFYGAYGLTNRWQIGLDLPVAFYYRYGDIDSVLSDVERYSNIGDLRLETIFQLLDKKQNTVGASITAWLSVPTGKSSHFLGDGKPTGSLIFALDKDVVEWLTVTLNLGGVFRETVK